MIVTEKIVRALKTLASKMTTPHAHFSQARRTPQEHGPGRVSEEVYNAMTQAERYAYARGFDQTVFKNSNGGPRNE